jgi:hypothetical protein
VNLAGMTGVITSPRFGTPRRARGPRRVDLGAKWTF